MNQIYQGEGEREGTTAPPPPQPSVSLLAGASPTATGNGKGSEVGLWESPCKYVSTLRFDVSTVALSVLNSMVSGYAF